jgi:hypothetical protein
MTCWLVRKGGLGLITPGFPLLVRPGRPVPVLGVLKRHGVQGDEGSLKGDLWLLRERINNPGP